MKFLNFLQARVKPTLVDSALFLILDPNPSMIYPNGTAGYMALGDSALQRFSWDLATIFELYAWLGKLMHQIASAEPLLREDKFAFDELNVDQEYMLAMASPLLTFKEKVRISEKILLNVPPDALALLKPFSPAAEFFVSSAVSYKGATKADRLKMIAPLAREARFVEWQNAHTQVGVEVVHGEKDFYGKPLRIAISGDRVTAQTPGHNLSLTVAGHLSKVGAGTAEIYIADVDDVFYEYLEIRPVCKTLVGANIGVPRWATVPYKSKTTVIDGPPVHLTESGCDVEILVDSKKAGTDPDYGDCLAMTIGWYLVRGDGSSGHLKDFGVVFAGAPLQGDYIVPLYSSSIGAVCRILDYNSYGARCSFSGVGPSLDFWGSGGRDAEAFQKGGSDLASTFAIRCSEGCQGPHVVAYQNNFKEEPRSTSSVSKRGNGEGRQGPRRQSEQGTTSSGH